MPRPSLAVTLLALLLPPHPDLSGTWVLASESCLPEKAHTHTGSYRMTVQQTDPVLHVTIKSSSKGQTHELSLSYKTNGEQLHYTGLDGDDFRSTPHWQASDLLFTILELEDGKPIHTQETWQLRKNGAELLRTKKENGEHKRSTCTAVFTHPVNP